MAISTADVYTKFSSATIALCATLKLSFSAVKSFICVAVSNIGQKVLKKFLVAEGKDGNTTGSIIWRSYSWNL